ncbi:MAG: alpha-L-arabinofuranosidase, partial [Pseudomonadota bacterium]
DLLAEAGEEVDLVAIHMMHQSPHRDDTILVADHYRQDYDRAWEELGEIFATVRDKVAEARDVMKSSGSDARLAITEGHLSLKPHNKCPILREWIAGLYHARTQNLYVRNADIVDIATLSDFFGTTWMVNALMLGSPREAPYLMPAGKIARFYQRYMGDYLIEAAVANSSLDIAATRRGNILVLHIVNTDLHDPQPVSFHVNGDRVMRAEVTMIAPGSPGASVYGDEYDPIVEQTITLKVPTDGVMTWHVPAASVSAVQLHLAD